jgi:5,10-methylene-tetrahydrofolate dehydrogenase/methenyl tetrahydrofolate cyclohydrolase
VTEYVNSSKYVSLVNNLDSDLITNSVDPSKDVDGLHFENAGKLITGLRDDAFVPCK